MENTEPLQIDTFLPYMRDVIRCEQALQELNLMWRIIESSAKMNCPEEARAILPTMAATRDAQGRIQPEPVCCLMRTAVRQGLAQFLAEGGRQVQAWAATQRCVQVVFDQPGEREAFFNANTLADLSN